MQARTIRRLLVFGVCLAGVGCLYLLPSVARPSGQAGTAGTAPSRQQLSPGDTGAARSTGARAAAGTTVSARPVAAGTGPSTAERGIAVRREGLAGDSHPGPTAAEPGRDDTAPVAVGGISVLHADTERLTVSWAPARDDTGVVEYRVWLNGFPVLTTPELRATLSWFNDADTHVVQVRAVDAAGNEGPPSHSLLVTRPGSNTADRRSRATDITDPSARATGAGGTEEDHS